MSRRVMGPVFPEPIGRPSISSTGVRCAAVPVKKTSSALYISERGICRSTVPMASSLRASSITVLRVMPTSIPSPGAGVTSSPPETTKTFSPEPSETLPSCVSMMASSYPLSKASVLASALFT